MIIRRFLSNKHSDSLVGKYGMYANPPRNKAGHSDTNGKNNTTKDDDGVFFGNLNFRGYALVKRFYISSKFFLRNKAFCGSQVSFFKRVCQITLSYNIIKHFTLILYKNASQSFRYFFIKSGAFYFLGKFESIYCDYSHYRALLKWRRDEILPNLSNLAAKSTVVLFLTLAITAAPAHADFSSEVDSYLSNVGLSSNVTSPTSYKGKDAEYYSLGSVYARTDVKNIQPVNVRLPEFRAGCGGIDIFAGGFSFIDSDQFIAFGKKVAANAGGFGAKMALSLICPMCEKHMSELQKLANEINNFNLNSCEVAQNAIGAMASMNTRTASAFCKAKKNGHGYDDYSDARSGCDNKGKAADMNFSEEEKNAGAPPLNLVWRVLTQNKGASLSSDDQKYYELLMSMTGTIIMRKPSDDPQISSINPTITDQQFINNIINGGDVALYTCDEKVDCLRPNRVTQKLPANKSFKGRVQSMISSIREKINTESFGGSAKFTNAEQSFIANSPYGLPILKIIEVQSAHKKFDTVFSLNGLEDWVALNLVYEYLGKLINQVETRSLLTTSLDQESKKTLINNISSIRQIIFAEIGKHNDKINTINTQIKTASEIEGYLNKNNILVGMKR